MSINNLKVIAKSDLSLSLFRTFIARGVAAIGDLLLLIVLGQLFGTAGVGTFALAQSIYIGSSLLARFGMDNSLMRYVGQDHHSNLVKHYLFLALFCSICLSSIAAIAIYYARHFFAEIFTSPLLISMLPAIALAVPAFTASFVVGGFMKGARKPATACLLENGSISLIVSLLVIFLHSIAPLNLVTVAWTLAVAAWLVLFQGIFQLCIWLKNHGTSSSKLSRLEKSNFFSSSRSFFIISLAQFLQQVLGVMIAGYLLSTDELGLFRSAERAAFIISFILIVINSVFPPRFANLYKNNKLSELNLLARKSSIIGTVLALPLCLICLLAPQWVLSFFGDGFVHAENLLRILVLAQLINVSTGSLALLLNMTGYERLMRNIVLSCSAVGALLFIFLTNFFGALGAALAMALVLVLQNLIALIYTWKKLGIWMLPTSIPFVK